MFLNPGTFLSLSTVPNLKDLKRINKYEINDLWIVIFMEQYFRQRKLNDEIRSYIFSKRVKHPINITLTEKQSVDRQKLDEISSQQNFRHFKNKLNKKVFGNSYRRFNQQLDMLVVRECGFDKRQHIHCVIEQPQRLEFEEFSFLITELWKETKFGYHQIHIEKPTTPQREEGWLGYILKGRTKVDLSSSIDFENSTVLSR